MTSSRPLRPVAAASVPAVAAAAEALIDETATVLLRSGSGSAERALAYQQIAAAVGSTKILLRST